MKRSESNGKISCLVGDHVLDMDPFGLDRLIAEMMVEFGFDCDQSLALVPLFKEYLVVMVDDGGWTLDDVRDLDGLEGLWNDYNFMLEGYEAGEAFRSYLLRALIEPCRASFTERNPRPRGSPDDKRRVG